MDSTTPDHDPWLDKRPANRPNRRRKNNMWHADRMSQKRKSDTAATAATSTHATSEAADLAVSPSLRPSRSSSDIARSSSFQLQQQQKFIETPVAAAAAKGADMYDIHNTGIG